jgi:hypothetical protein
MGGSGGGGGGGDYRPRGDGGGGSDPQPNCSGLRFATTLEQPHGAPVHGRGAVFELVLTPSGGRVVVVAIDDDGDIIGTVVDELPNLLRCMDSGWAFVAEVVTVNYGIHSVVVRPAVLHEGAGAYWSAPGSPTSGPLQLVGSAAVDVVVASTLMDRSGIAELRSLVRTGTPLDGEVAADGATTVWFAGT